MMLTIEEDIHILEIWEVFSNEGRKALHFWGLQKSSKILSMNDELLNMVKGAPERLLLSY